MAAHPLISLLVLFFLTTGCQQKGWICREVISDCPKFHSAQMKYPASNLFNGIEVQFLKGEFDLAQISHTFSAKKCEKSELVGFLNIFSRRILTNRVIFEIGESFYEFSGYIMAGGQRLQLPLCATEELIKAFSAGQKVIIYLEGFSAEIPNKNFNIEFQKRPLVAQP